jgi:predicted kinase
MGELTAVVGLPGAGKSTLLRQMRCSVAGLCIEDFHADAKGNSAAVEDSRQHHALVEAIRAGHDCVIADIAFCCPQRRHALQQRLSRDVGVEIRWVYFENAPDKCRRNILRRARESQKADLEALERFAAVYSIPDGVTPLQIKEA